MASDEAVLRIILEDGGTRSVPAPARPAPAQSSSGPVRPPTASLQPPQPKPTLQPALAPILPQQPPQRPIPPLSTAADIRARDQFIDLLKTINLARQDVVAFGKTMDGVQGKLFEMRQGIDPKSISDIFVNGTGAAHELFDELKKIQGLFDSGGITPSERVQLARSAVSNTATPSTVAGTAANKPDWIRSLVDGIAGANRHVLIEGESGSGKSFLTRSIAFERAKQGEEVNVLDPHKPETWKGVSEVFTRETASDFSEKMLNTLREREAASVDARSHGESIDFKPVTFALSDFAAVAKEFPKLKDTIQTVLTEGRKFNIAVLAETAGFNAEEIGAGTVAMRRNFKQKVEMSAPGFGEPDRTAKMGGQIFKTPDLSDASDANKNKFDPSIVRYKSETQPEPLPPPPQFDPRTEAQKRREAERRRAQIDTAYKEEFGDDSKRSGLDKLLDVAGQFRGVIGGFAGTMVGATLDIVSAFRKAQIEVQEERRKAQLLREVTDISSSTLKPLTLPKPDPILPKPDPIIERPSAPASTPVPAFASGTIDSGAATTALVHPGERVEDMTGGKRNVGTAPILASLPPHSVVLPKDLAEYTRSVPPDQELAAIDSAVSELSRREGNFNKWFSSSKVVDKQGQPKPVFHGTPYNEFTEFKKDKLGDPQELAYGPGYYFTDSKAIADDYREHGSGIPGANAGAIPQGKGHVFETFLSLQKIFDIDKDKIKHSDLESSDAAIRFGTEIDKLRTIKFSGKGVNELTDEEWERAYNTYTVSDDRVKETLTGFGTSILDEFSNLDHFKYKIKKLGHWKQDWSKIDSESVKALEAINLPITFPFPSDYSYTELSKHVPKVAINDVLEGVGYDSLTHIGKHGSAANRKIKNVSQHRVHIVLPSHANKIKSATDNVGTFNPDTPDIRYATGTIDTGNAQQAIVDPGERVIPRYATGTIDSEPTPQQAIVDPSERVTKWSPVLGSDDLPRRFRANPNLIHVQVSAQQAIVHPGERIEDMTGGKRDVGSQPVLANLAPHSIVLPKDLAEQTRNVSPDQEPVAIAEAIGKLHRRKGIQIPRYAIGATNTGPGTAMVDPGERVVVPRYQTGTTDSGIYGPHRREQSWSSWGRSLIPDKDTLTKTIEKLAGTEGLGKLLDIGPMTTMAVAGIAMLGKGAVATAKMMDQSATNLSKYNAQIATAVAFAEARQIYGDIRRAQEAAPVLSRFVNASSELQQRSENLKIEFIKMVGPLITELVNVASIAVGLLSSILNGITEVAGFVAGLPLISNLIASLDVVWRWLKARFGIQDGTQTNETDPVRVIMENLFTDIGF